MRGASGALVTLTNTEAVKTVADEGPARERLRAQFRWLMLHAHEPNVRVRIMRPDGYIMEQLCENDVTAFNPAWLIAPAERLWVKPAEVIHDADAHHEWVLTKMAGAAGSFGNEFLSKVMLLERYVRSRSKYLTRCLTHGDLTRANTLCRATRSHVLIDPIPATPACADVWAFDVSTVVISLLGLEHVVYRWPPPDDREHIWLEQLLMRLNPVELECVRYMGVVQIARRLPYFPKETHDGLIEIAREAIRIRP